MSQNFSATTASVAASTSAVTLLALQPVGVTGRMIFNDSTSVLYAKFGAGATSTSFTVLIPAGGYYEVPSGGHDGSYGGLITGVWTSTNGSARVTEVL